MKKSVFRSLAVLLFISSIGWLGLWFLGKQGAEIKVENSDFIVEADEFFNFGGATPKETLKLFIAALEKNDLILAVKYFIPENRETESEDLMKLYEIHLLGDLLKDLKSIKSGKGLDDGRYRFEVLDETGQAAAELELIKNQKGFWKIISL